MKKGIVFNVNLTNRFAYSIIVLLSVLLIGVSVFAFGTSDPSTFGHSAKELDLSAGVVGDTVFLGSVNVTGTVTGSNLKDAQCSAGQIVQGFDASGNIVCIEDAGGGGSYTEALVNGDHTGSECMAANGIPEPVTGEGNYVCKFVGSCPSGWSQYNKWSSTSASTCVGGGNGCSVGYCSTGGHAFMDKTAESCSYTVYVKGGGDQSTCQPSGRSCSANTLETGCY